MQFNAPFPPPLPLPFPIAAVCLAPQFRPRLCALLHIHSQQTSLILSPHLYSAPRVPEGTGINCKGHCPLLPHAHTHTVKRRLPQVRCFQVIAPNG
ncbi:hypothetical protein CDAR_559341 [Caerostris darwini]|uniref:Secreted protein n=1 Tax=Caerostris darwini TaxID=1538125 RepID=A0AAV4NZM1_9ARAC|nr:hypothetical protein CDAR_559341 [Caerostris darwini]